MLVVEDALNRAAEKLGIDPAEIRRRNYYGEAPRNTTPYGQDNADSHSGTDENAAPTISIEVNGDARSVVTPCSIVDLLDALDLGGKRVAVAVNRDVVIRSRYSETALAAGARVALREAVGGG